MFAAIENSQAALVLWRDVRNYPLTHYVAGLAVESMFRAYAMRWEEDFDARHDLTFWKQKARFDSLIGKSEIVRVELALAIVIGQWNNSQRFYSEELLGVYLRRMKRDRGIKGNHVKELTSQIVDSSILLVSLGAVKWKK